MNTKTPKVLIIGAGLTGLTTAYLLKKQGISAIILEARNRIGGRIQTIYKEGEAPLELGATWLGKKHTQLIALLQQLGLDIHEQVLGKTAVYEHLSTSPPQLVTLPPNTDPSFRIKGGTMRLIKKLASHLAENQIHLGQVVQLVKFEKDNFKVETNQSNYAADYLISTLPPNLLVNTVDFIPNLLTEIEEIAKQTHTWMGESIKVGFTFKSPFWEKIGSSATIFSNVGPISEMYNHSNFENTQFAIKGFMNGVFYAATKETRKNLLLNQLRKYYGDVVLDYSTYLEGIWRTEPFTFYHYGSHIFPHQNNGNALFSKPLMENRFFLAGSETAGQFPGYMDGAVRSAQAVVSSIFSFL